MINLSIRELLLLGLATFSVFHIVVELVVYPLVVPAQDELLAGHRSHSLVAAPFVPRSAGDEEQTEEDASLPEWQQEERRRDKIKGGQAPFFYYEPRDEWHNRAVPHPWCDERFAYHRGAWPSEECYDWLSHRLMGPGQGLFHTDRRRGTVKDHLTPAQASKYRIAIVLIWLEPTMPKWGNYFLTSVAANSDLVDWIFVVQTGRFTAPRNMPSNFKLQWVDDVEKFFSARLGMPFTLNNSPSNRINDLKPTLGLALQKELKDYTHWGFGDVDLVYGKFTNMLTERELGFYDVISFLGEDASHFYHATMLTIFKNTEFSRTYWKVGSGPEPHVSHSGEGVAFDEKRSSDLLWSYDNVRALYTIGRLFNDVCTTPSDFTFKVKNGVLTRTRSAKDGRPTKTQKEEEGIAVHFVLSMQMGEVNIKPRDTIDPKVGMAITLYPDSQFASSAS